MSSENDSHDFEQALDEQTYAIEDELKIRKVLERHTDWNIEFSKNDDKYAYDICYYKWDVDDVGHEKKLAGFVELERSSTSGSSCWSEMEIPDNWVYWSFLKRKVYKYDYQIRRWGGPKDELESTVYLKFNLPLTNCFAAPLSRIYHDGAVTKASRGGPKNTYLSLPFGHDEVYFGIDESMEFIDRFMDRNASGQVRLDSLSFSEDDAK